MHFLRACFGQGMSLRSCGGVLQLDPKFAGKDQDRKGGSLAIVLSKYHNSGYSLFGLCELVLRYH